MKELYAMALIYGNMVTEQEIIVLYDEEYLQEVLELKNEFLKQM